MLVELESVGGAGDAAAAEDFVKQAADGKVGAVAEAVDAERTADKRKTSLGVIPAFPIAACARSVSLPVNSTAPSTTICGV